MAQGNNSLVRWRIGQLPTSTALFTNTANTPTNPTTATFQLVTPAGAQTDYASGGAQVANPATGTFVFTYPGTTGIQTVGTWTWRWKGVGALVDADEGTWEVLPTGVVTP